MTLKKGSFRLVHRNLWRWYRTNKIRGNTLLVHLALETGPWGAGHYTGLFRLGIYDIMDYTGLTHSEASKAIDALERRRIIVFDRDRQVVYVAGMLKRQSTNYASSENSLQGVVNHVDRMPEGSPAVAAFIEAQRNEAELFELLEGYLGGDHEGDFEQTCRPVDLKTRRPEDSKTLRPEDEEIVSAVKSPALTPPPPDPPNPLSKPRSSASPNGDGESKAKGNGKARPKATAKASGKGNGEDKGPGLSKKEGLSIVAMKFKAGELDVYQVSEMLRSEYRFTGEEINSPDVLKALGLGNKEAAN